MNKKTKQQLDDLIINYKKNKERIEKLQSDNDFIKNRIMFLLGKAKTKTFEYYNPEMFPDIIKCTVCERKTLSYNVQRAKELLGRKRLNSILDKDYSIGDIEKLKELAKSHGISVNELKSCLEVQEKINSKKLDQAYNLGEIDDEEVEEFVKVDTTSKYLTFK